MYGSRWLPLSPFQQTRTTHSRGQLSLQPSYFPESSLVKFVNTPLSETSAYSCGACFSPFCLHGHVPNQETGPVGLSLEAWEGTGRGGTFAYWNPHTLAHFILRFITSVAVHRSQLKDIWGSDLPSMTSSEHFHDK